MTIEAITNRTITWIEGWRTSPDAPFNLDAFRHIYAQDDRFSSFDFGRPHDGFTDWATAEAYYRKFMTVPANWRLEPTAAIEVTIRGNVAWSTVPLHATGSMPDGTEFDFPECRVTLIFEKDGDDWLIVHEHGSSPLPFPDEETTKAMLPV
ncbi:MAG: nuclear transport factor 2 family protein [Pseudomonadota bacterium]